MPKHLHIAYLDSVRGLAALAVVSEHFIIAYGLPCTGSLCSQLLDYSPLHLWWDGTAAVSMFFVLSGLVLSLKYFREGHTPSLEGFSLRRYLVNRLFRIWPPYCAVWLLSALLYPIVTDTPLMQTEHLPLDPWLSQMWHGHALSWGERLREVFLPRLPDAIVLIPQAWTLTLELNISLLLPAGLLLMQRGTGWLLLFTLLLTGSLGAPVFLLHFLMGLWLARHWIAISRYLLARPLHRRILLLMGLPLYTVNDIHQGWLNETGLWLLSGLGAVLILLYVSGSLSSQRVLNGQTLRMIGKVSYSLYLLHITVLIGLIPPLLHGLEPLIPDRFALWACGWLLTLTLSLAVSRWSYAWLEQPSMAMGKYRGG
ncbi:acyltransferase [Candidatus Woesearchaeota archaeon]|nr:acyltransferase [Candidatus Woesearchaeota archaeon]